MKTDLDKLKSMLGAVRASSLVIGEPEMKHIQMAYDAVAELRAARAVVEAAHKVTDGAPMEYLERRIPERNLAAALLAYDKVVGS